MRIGRFWAGISTSALIAGLPQVAIGQDGARDEVEGATLDSEAARSDTIVVTATKRAQDLQDVSLAITVVDSTRLTDTRIDTLEDLQVAVPALTVGNDFAFAKIFMRGLGLNSSLPGLDPSVALHVDGAVISQPAMQFASLYDLERVEVLRGPQGTLYGRNATGGSINLITAKPTDYFEGYARATVGGDDLNLIGEAALSGPLADGIQARVAVRYQNREGFGTFTRTGQDIDDANKFGIRGQLNFDFSDRVSNLISAEYYREDERSRSGKLLAPSFSDQQIAGLPTIISAQNRPQSEIDAMLAQIPNLRTLAQADSPVNSRDVGGDLIPVGDIETWSITNTFEAGLSDALTFRSITNYRDGESILLQDFDASNLVTSVDVPGPSTVQAPIVRNQQFSQELQLLIEAGPLSGILGAFYFEDDVFSLVSIGTDPLGAIAAEPDYATIPNGAPLRELFPASRLFVIGDMDVEAYALFGNFVYSVSDNFRLKAGARYSDESRDIVVDTRLPGPGITLPTGSDSDSFSDFSMELGVELDVGDTLLYATYSEGFKSGTAGLGDSTPEIVDPETIENFEIGLKGLYFDNRLRLALAGFMYQVDDAQFDRTRLLGIPPFFTTSVENAAYIDGAGIELEGTVFVTDNFTLDFNGAYYDITFDSFITEDPIEPLGALEGLAGLPVRTEDLSGNRVRNTPEFSGGVRGTYSTMMVNGAALDMSAAYTYTGDQFYTEFEDERLSADGYGLVDANIKYTFPNRNWSVNVWGKNLTDEFVVSGAFAISTSRTIVGTFLPPRTYGVTVGYEF